MDQQALDNPQSGKGDSLTAMEVAARLVLSEAKLRGIKPLEVISKRRHRPICEARAAVWAKMRDEKITLEEIGDIFGRCHTTIRQGINNHKQQ